MASNKQTLWLEIRADDKASGAIAAVGDSVKRLPEGFAKASTAITTLGSAMGGIDGAAGAAIGKVSGLAQVMMSGGPLGIAIAATTAAVAVGTAVWAAHREEVQANEAASRALASSLDSYRVGAQAAAKLVADTRAELEGAGLSGEDKRLRDTDKRIGDITAGIESMAQANERLQAEIDAVWFSAERNGKLVGGQVVDTRKINAEQERLIEGNRAIIAQNSAKVADLQREADLLQQASENMVAKARADAAAEAASKRRARAAKDAADAEREAERLARQRASAIEQVAAARLRSEQEVQREITALHQTHEDYRLAIAIKATNERAEAEERAMQRAIDAEASRAQYAASLASDVIGVWGQAAASIASGQQSADDAMRQAAIQSAQVIVTTAAAKAAAEAFAAHAWMPFVGLAVGGAAASAIFAAVMAYGDRFATGGTVRGGIAGRDSVPALLMPGEEVLPVPEANRYRAARGQGGGGSGAVVINATLAPQFAHPVLPDAAQTRRWLVRNLKPALEDLIRNGQINLARAW